MIYHIFYPVSFGRCRLNSLDCCWKDEIISFLFFQAVLSFLSWKSNLKRRSDVIFIIHYYQAFLSDLAALQVFPDLPPSSCQPTFPIKTLIETRGSSRIRSREGEEGRGRGGRHISVRWRFLITVRRFWPCDTSTCPVLDRFHYFMVWSLKEIRGNWSSSSDLFITQLILLTVKVPATYIAHWCYFIQPSGPLWDVWC